MKRQRLEVRVSIREAILAGCADSARGVLPWPLLIAVVALAIALGWISPASAEEASDPGEPRTGGGEVSINGGEVYAGEGCVRIGEVNVGDCESDDAEGESATATEATLTESGAPEETTALEATSRETTFSEDSVPEKEHATCPTKPTGETHATTVERAIDGDTLEISGMVEGASRVRLIGVDSPETNASAEGARPEPGTAEAARLADALIGEEVVLELDEDLKDDHGRLLAYVWTGAEKEGLWSGLKRLVGMDEIELFNLRLVDRGHADALTVEPNDAYAECFEDAGRRAESGAISDEQHGERMNPEQTGPEGTAPEKTISEATENTSVEEPETTQEMHSEQPTPEETTVSEGNLSETVPAEGQYEETTTTEAVEAPASEPSASEETYPAPEATTEAEPAPTTSITLEPDTSPESTTGEPQSSGGGPYESVEEQYEPPEDVAKGPALDTLPTVGTPEGTVPVLPDTGGAFALPVLASVLGAACLVVGVFGPALLAVLGSRRGRAPERR